MANSKIYDCLLVVVLIVGFFLRLYKLDIADGWLDAVDVSKDILVAEHIVEYKEFTLTSPCAVGGKGFLKNSPLHYYFIAFFWLLARSPEGVLFCGVIIGVLTIYLSYLIGKELSSKSLGFLFALFFTFNEPLIKFSTLTIQPFYLPFFTVLIIYLLLLFRRNKRFFLLVAAVFSIWFALNIHYSFLQLFLAFNLLILIMLFFDKKMVSVKIRGLLVWGSLNLILMILWLVTSQNYEFLKNITKSSLLMDGELGGNFFETIYKNICSFIRLVFFGSINWFGSDWSVAIFGLIILIIFVFLWFMNQKIRASLFSLMFLFSGCLMTALIKDGVGRAYFVTYVPILLMLVIYLFYCLYKINWCFVIGLLFLFLLSFKSVFLTFIQKSHLIRSNLYYAEVITNTISDDFNYNFKNIENGFQIYSTNNQGMFMLGTPYYYFLEKKYGQILTVGDLDFFWPQENVSYVSCVVSSYTKDVQSECLSGLGDLNNKKITKIKTMVIDGKYYYVYRVL